MWKQRRVVSSMLQRRLATSGGRNQPHRDQKRWATNVHPNHSSGKSISNRFHSTNSQRTPWNSHNAPLLMAGIGLSAAVLSEINKDAQNDAKNDAQNNNHTKDDRGMQEGQQSIRAPQHALNGRVHGKTGIMSNECRGHGATNGSTIANTAVTATVNVPGAAELGIMAHTTSCDDDRSTTSLVAKFLGSRRTSGFLSQHQSPHVRRIKMPYSSKTLERKYDVQWNTNIGEGTFGTIFRAKNRETGKMVAIKKIPKRYTQRDQFFAEMDALLHLRQNGGHPGINSLIEYFNERGNYYLVLDLIDGIELFEHLVDQGAYSEADASRLMREVAAALTFLHGIGITHGDLKPENLMLSSKDSNEAVIKLVDFGCSQVDHVDHELAEDHPAAQRNQSDRDDKVSLAGKTLAYSPPEILDPAARKRLAKLDPSLDMWALGVILYIMLTGFHPYDLNGQASDEEVTTAIISDEEPPIRGSPMTAHLSESAIDLIERLMCRDPAKRLTAFDMLHHSWVKGETANTLKMQTTSEKLAGYRKHKTKLAHYYLTHLLNDESANNSDSLTESALSAFNSDKDRFPGIVSSNDNNEPLTLSNFSSVLRENMADVHFPPGSVIYREGEIGNNMFFIESGIVSIETSTGFHSRRKRGNYFGEGALFDPSKRRSATVRSVTPVHTRRIRREFFEDFLEDSDPNLFLKMREKDKVRKRNRMRSILSLQRDLILKEYRNGDFLFRDGDDGDSLFIVKEGKVAIEANGKHVLSATPGNIIGEHAMLTRQPRNCTALCDEKTGCIVHQFLGQKLRVLMEEAPYIETTLKEMCIRRDFKKAVVLRLNKEFPYDNPREAFDAIQAGDSEFLDAASVGPLMRMLHPYTDEEVDEIIRTIDLNHSGSISYDEFKTVFVANRRESDSM